MTESEIELQRLRTALFDERGGALVEFSGLVRNHNEGMDVASLEYEAYAELAVKQGNAVLAEATEKFGVYGIYCVHRTGHLQIGDVAVWVGVLSAHRDGGFLACRFVIDEIKARLPIWKKEHYVDGRSEWVDCRQCSSYQSHKRHTSTPEARL